VPLPQVSTDVRVRHDSLRRSSGIRRALSRPRPPGPHRAPADALRAGRFGSRGAVHVNVECA